LVDDYALIDSVRREGVGGLLGRFGPLHRPLAYFISLGLFSHFGDNVAPMVAIAVVAHALCAPLLYWLCRQLGLGALPAFMTGLLFLCFPFRNQAILWSCEMVQPLTLMVFLAGACALAAWCVRPKHWGVFAAAFVLVASASLMYDEIFALFPLLLFVGAVVPGSSRRRSLTGAGVLLLVGACVAFLATRTSLGSLAQSHPASTGLAFTTLRSLRNMLALCVSSLGGPLLDASTELLMSVPGVMSTAALCCVGALFVRNTCRGGRECLDSRGHAHLWVPWGGTGLLLLLSLAILGTVGFTGHWGRVSYMPSLALAMWLGASYGIVFSALSNRRSGITFLVVGAAAVSIAYSAVNQWDLRAFATQHDREQSMLRVLRGALPEPEAGTVFVFVPWKWRAHRSMDTSFIYEMPENLLRRTYGRTDIRATPRFSLSAEGVVWRAGKHPCPYDHTVILAHIGRSEFVAVTEVRLAGRRGERTVSVPLASRLPFRKARLVVKEPLPPIGRMADYSEARLRRFLRLELQ